MPVSPVIGLFVGLALFCLGAVAFWVSWRNGRLLDEAVPRPEGMWFVRPSGKVLSLCLMLVAAGVIFIGSSIKALIRG